MSKTHFRKVFKSDHLGSADLEDLVEQGSNLVFTIEEVRQEIGVKIAGVKTDKNIAYFKETKYNTNPRQLLCCNKSKCIHNRWKLNNCRRSSSDFFG